MAGVLLASADGAIWRIQTTDQTPRMVHRYGQRSPTRQRDRPPSGSAQTCHAGIGTASLLADAGREIPTALLPSLLTSTFGASAPALGVIEVISDALDAARPG